MEDGQDGMEVGKDGMEDCQDGQNGWPVVFNIYPETFLIQILARRIRIHTDIAIGSRKKVYTDTNN